MTAGSAQSFQTSAPSVPGVEPQEAPGRLGVLGLPLRCRSRPRTARWRALCRPARPPRPGRCWGCSCSRPAASGRRGAWRPCRCRTRCCRRRTSPGQPAAAPPCGRCTGRSRTVTADLHLGRVHVADELAVPSSLIRRPPAASTQYSKPVVQVAGSWMPQMSVVPSSSVSWVSAWAVARIWFSR